MFVSQIIQPSHVKQENEDSKLFDDIFEKSLVEDAKNVISNESESGSIEAQKQLFCRIQRIVNAICLEKKDVNYTLDEAHTLGFQIYTNAAKQTGIERMDCMAIAKDALHLVAKTYLGLGAYCQALNVLHCLDTQETKNLQTNILNAWKNYIEKCSSQHKVAEQFMYETQLKILQNLHK